MRRATITLPDKLDTEVEHFRETLPARPSLTSVVEAALESYLANPPEARAGSDALSRVLRNRTEVRRIVSSRGGTTVRLFGSLARGEATSTSDVDLLVDVGVGTTLFDLAAMRSDLERLLDLPVDVVPSSSVDAKVRDLLFAEALTL